MSDNEADNNDNASVQESIGAGNEAADNLGADEIPSLNLDALHGTINRRNPEDELKGAKLEWLETEISDEVVDANAVLVPKNKRGEYGTRDYLRNLDSATYPLEPKMGVPSHFVSSRDGETEAGNQTKSQFIQEVFVSNNDKLQQALLRAEYYDMMAVFMVPTVRNQYGSKPNEILNEDGRNMFLHWDQMKWEDICLWQKTINKWAGENDRTSSKWAQSFLYKSSTLELRERVDSQYKSLPAAYKGGVTYLFLQLKVMFHMSRDTVTALKKYLKLLEEKGLRRYPGENMATLQKEALAVCVRLNEVNALPDETVVDILTGLTRCSVPEFTKLFDFVLQGARADALDLGINSGGDTLADIKIILAKAVDAYHALCTAGKWHVNHHKSSRVSLLVCWNCGAEGHRCETCTEPTNDANINAAKKKWQASGRSSGGGSGSGNGGKFGQQKTRQKWSRPEQNGVGVKWFSGVPKAYCGKKDAGGAQCGWNCDHSTNFHGKKMEDPSNFNLADWSPNHQLVLAQRRVGGMGQTKPPANSGAHANQIMIDKTKANDVLSKLERNSTSTETAEIVGALRNLMSLN